MRSPMKTQALYPQKPKPSNSKVKEPSGKHAFDQACQAIGAEHRLIPPRKPQTNGMVERFNGRISEVIKQTRFASAKDLEDTLMNYTRIYNDHIPQRALNHLSPLQSLQNWQTKKPKLFKISVPNHAGLDRIPQPIHRGPCCNACAFKID
jgi:hypothetical protein